MSKTLKGIQTFYRVWHILCKVALVCCIIGFVCTVVGAVLVGIGVPDTVKIDGKTLSLFVAEAADVSEEALFPSVICACLSTVMMAVLTYFASKYTANELDAGTPFHPDGVKELRRLSILFLALPMALVVLGVIVNAIFGSPADLDLSVDGMVSTGLMMLLLSFIYQYGAELKEQI